MRWVSLVALFLVLCAAPSFAESSDTSSYWDQVDQNLNELELTQQQLLSKIETLESQSIDDKELLKKQESSLQDLSTALANSERFSSFFETATWTLLAVVVVETLIIIFK